MSTILMSISYYYIYLNVNFDRNITAPQRQFQKTVCVFSNNLVLHQHSAVRNYLYGGIILSSFNDMSHVYYLLEGVKV